jgi:molybdopterin-guanine dinucleotide biosynthesis protein A
MVGSSWPGAVLCGGASARMGRDKALVPYQGVPMAARVAAALREGGCAPVVAIGGDAAGLPAVGLAVVPDCWPGQGPVGGVLTALAEWPDAQVVMVVSCDVPLLTAATVRAVLRALVAAPDAFVAVAVAGRVQPLCAAWRPAAGPALLAAFEAGERRMLAVLDRLPSVQVSVDAQDVQNVNAVGDLRQ